MGAPSPHTLRPERSVFLSRKMPRGAVVPGHTRGRFRVSALLRRPVRPGRPVTSSVVTECRVRGRPAVLGSLGQLATLSLGIPSARSLHPVSTCLCCLNHGDPLSPIGLLGLTAEI